MLQVRRISINFRDKYLLQIFKATVELLNTTMESNDDPAFLKEALKASLGLA